MRTILFFSAVAWFVIATPLSAQITPTYDDVMIPMSDMEELQADVYIPSGCTSCEVILIQTPYNKEVIEWTGLPLGVGTNIDDQPYAWVIVDWRGFYGSSGASTSSVDRGQDAFDICDWIVDQPWHGDRIGTWGPSALGNIQYQLIGKHHPNHTCAVPLVANPQFSYVSYFYGGVLEEARLEQLDALGYGLSPIVMANVYYNNSWQYAESTTFYPDDIEIPTLQIGGWYDHNIDEMMKFYKDSRALANPDVQDEQWLLVGPWVHGGTGAALVGSEVQGELFYPNAAGINNEMAWNFFEYYLLDSLNNWNETAPITYYEMGTNVWLTSWDDEVGAVNEGIFYLNSSNRLSAEIGNGNSILISDPADPSPTIGGATLHADLDQGPYDQTYLDGRDDIQTFETDSLTTEVTVTGRITVTLFVSADQPDCDIVVRLVDQYPDGTNMLVTDGIRRMRFRNGYTEADEQLMTPGEIYEVEVELPFTNYTWKVDHRIKIYIGANSAIRWNVNMQDGGPMYTSSTPQIANITILHDDNYQSRIILPSDDQILSVDPLTEILPISIYPNPANDMLYLQTDAQLISYALSDMQGRVVERGQINQNQISIADLESGIYLIHLTDVNGAITEKKFIKK